MSKASPENRSGIGITEIIRTQALIVFVDGEIGLGHRQQSYGFDGRIGAAQIGEGAHEHKNESGILVSMLNRRHITNRISISKLP